MNVRLCVLCTTVLDEAKLCLLLLKKIRFPKQHTASECGYNANICMHVMMFGRLLHLTCIACA